MITIRKTASARLLTQLMTLLLCGLMATPAAAWKPKTHIYLAEQARLDAIDDGKVTIYETDYETGKILAPLGAFEVNPAVLDALRKKPNQFRAGVVGPDAYPDILTGQQLIHPGTNKSLLGDPAKGELPSAAGSDAWLTHLWRKAYGPKSAAQKQLEEMKGAKLLGIEPSDTPEIRAFVSGYITHAAGDMFMHTFVNYYTGGDFAVMPDPTNAAKHIILESYVGLRTPETTTSGNIDGVDGFIYREMVRATPGSVLEQRLLQGAGDKSSVPAIFSQLRNSLQRDVDAYDRERMSRSGPSRLAYSTANGPEAEYKRAWVKDIDSGLRAWPQLSHDIAFAMVYDGTNTDLAKEAASKYVQDHLISMMGVPDFAIATVVFIKKVTSAALPAFLLEALSKIAMKPLDWMIEGATGKTLGEWAGYAKEPEVNFDKVVNAPGGGYGGKEEVLIDLGKFNKDVLKIDDNGAQFRDKRFKIESFPPAFNTVQMTKLSFLSEKGMNDLLAKLKAKGVNVPASAAAPGKYENAMLGFLNSLDGGNRWQGTIEKGQSFGGQSFFLARGDAGGWRHLFLKQVGERENWTKNAAPEKPPAEAPDDAGFQPIQRWAVRVDQVDYGAASGAGRNVAVTATFRNDAADPMTFTERQVRTVLNRKDGVQVPQLRMGYVHQTEDDLPAWHYLPNTAIPPKGRITVRFVHEVGDLAAQQKVEAWTVIEQTPTVAGLGIKYVDGKSVRLPIPALGGGGKVTSPAETLPEITDGPANKAFTAAGELSYRLDAAGRRLGAGAPIEVALTARRDQEKPIRLQTAYHTYVLVGTDGVEYRNDGNVYVSSGDEPMKVGRLLTKGDQIAVTYVFKGVPPKVDAARFLVRSGKTLVAEFYVQGAPVKRPVYGPGGAAAGGIAAGSPVPLKRFDARVVSMNRGDDRNWEAVIALKSKGGPMTKITASDIDMSIYDASGETRHEKGDFYLPNDLSRKVHAETLLLLNGMEVQVRIWFPDSASLAPISYKLFETFGETKGGPIAPDFLAGKAR